MLFNFGDDFIRFKVLEKFKEVNVLVNEIFGEYFKFNLEGEIVG